MEGGQLHVQPTTSELLTILKLEKKTLKPHCILGENTLFRTFKILRSGYL